jgi:5-formyltetrahydrofolate cyclo-ligase
MDKKALRARLMDERNNLSDRAQRALALQQVMRIWLIGRSDARIGAYWPIKSEFDPLPALYRWQEDGALPHRIGEPDADAQAAEHLPKYVSSSLADEFAAPQFQRKIGLPVINKIDKTLTFHAWYPGCPMEEDAYNIPKPKGTEVVEPTLLFVPCLGFTQGGYRLGYGGGFYDRTLAALTPKPVTVGLAFAMGYSEDFAPEPHDVPLDAILTDQGVAWTSI